MPGPVDARVTRNQPVELDAGDGVASAPDVGQKPHRTIEVAAPKRVLGSDNVAHAHKHIRGGSDEIDGDLLDIDYSPSNYTPVVMSPALHMQHLAAHLAGVDAAIGGATRPAWQWNGEDVSQFEATPWQEIVSGSISTNTLEVVSNAYGPGENALRLTFVGSTASGLSTVWLINEPLPRNYHMEVWYRTGTFSAGYWGFAHNASRDNDDDLYAYVTLGPRWKFRVDNDVSSYDSGTLQAGSWPRSANSFGHIQLDMVSELTGESPPHWLMQNTHNNLNSTFAVGGNLWSDYSASSPPAGWNDLQCDRVGLAAKHNNGGTIIVDVLKWSIYER